MRFIKNGPDVPNRLLHEHAEGRVVFFCGSGISVPAGLPDFKGLAYKLFDRVGEAPTPVESTPLKNGLYDTAIGLLERRVAGGPRKVREALPDLLTPEVKSEADLATHRALLDLSADQYDQVRLVTTNFDHLFRHAQSQTRYQVLAYQAPLLPVPKGHLRGIVYLHGLLPENSDAADIEQLVLSSGDFGRAYLTERWAARFVSDWATRTLPTDGLLSVVSTIRRILDSAEGKKAQYWNDRVKPYFERIWPKDKALIDKSTANGVADVCISAGPAFPDAVEVLTPWLRYASGPELVAYRLNESTLPDDVPDSVLEFLDVVVPSGANPVPHKLGSVLARIADSGDTYTELSAYRRLRDACRRAGSPIQKQT